VGRCALTLIESDYYSLRTEWLRFKGHLFDGLTSLPTLAAVVEDVRRLIESSGGVDVVCIDLGRSGRYEAKLGWALYDEAVRDFGTLLSSLRESGELLPGAILCLHAVRSDRFLVFLPSPTGDPGSPPARDQRERLVNILKEALGDARLSSGLRAMTFTAGHAELARAPSVRAERAIQQAVASAMMMSLAEQEGIEAGRREELSRIIARGRIRTVFHPIVRLADKQVVGHEALTRPLDGGSFGSVEELFCFAESTDLLLEFERLCRCVAIRNAAEVQGPGLLFLNASARAVVDSAWSHSEMDAMLAQSGFSPRRVVVEITERVAVESRDVFREALKAFKGRGYLLGVDDMGAGHSSLSALAEVEPDFLKVDASLVRGIDRSGIKRGLLQSLRVLAEKIHARVIAEGIERSEEEETLLGLGIELGQGLYFHREASPW